MEITVIDDRVELNGFTLAHLSNPNPSLRYQFEAFLQGRDESDLDGSSYNAGFEAGKEEGAHSVWPEVETAQSELADLVEALQDVIGEIKDGKLSGDNITSELEGLL